MSKYLENVERYVDSPNVDAVEALVGHLGIALQNRDSAGVAVTDPSELEAVKKGYCSKTLDLDSDAADQAIATVSEKMKADNPKCRVTFYYLLAEETNTLHRLAG